MPEAAERALVSVATAYRYFPSADELWWEASAEMVEIQPTLAEADGRIDAAGDDPQARLDVLVRTIGFWLLDEPLLARTIAKAALEQWLNQAGSPDPDRMPVRQGRRNEFIRKVLVPLRDEIPEQDLDRIAHALGVVVGTDATLALTDGVGLDVPAAKEALLDAGRWLLAGALADLGRGTAP